MSDEFNDIFGPDTPAPKKHEPIIIAGPPISQADTIARAIEAAPPEMLIVDKVDLISVSAVKEGTDEHCKFIEIPTKASITIGPEPQPERIPVNRNILLNEYIELLGGHALEVLEDVPGIAFVHFSDADVVRHPLVTRIVRAYDKAEGRAKAGARYEHDGAERDDAER